MVEYTVRDENGVQIVLVFFNHTDVSVELAICAGSLDLFRIMNPLIG